jgi:UDP-GlcNAc:undecaprenyl-phosphate GlcNAc-1-phosphate transferase
MVILFGLTVVISGLSYEDVYGTPGQANWYDLVLPMLEHGKIYLTSLMVSYVSIQGLAISAPKLQMLDKPDHARKVHTVAKPIVGGLGMVAGILMAMTLFSSVGSYVGLMLAIIMIAVTGALDDRFDISFKLRFIVQIAASLVIIYIGGTKLNTFGNIFGLGAVETGLLAIPITIFCILGVINAMNMIDGLDGLAGGTSLVAFLAFAILALINKMTGLMLLSIAFVGALAAFLRFNWHPSKLFMGDAGSMTLGFVLAFFSIELTQKPDSLVSPVAALFVLALPVTDTLTVMIKRMLKGNSPFKPDNTHLHHILKSMDISHGKVVVIMVVMTGFFASLAVIATMLRVPDYVLFVAFLVWFSAYFAASYKTDIIRKAVNRFYRQY